ncbi:hypothetical protein [Fonticella tunisiensis]|nr:hypothetical protein [Fonticella tunisiensis]
MFNLEHVICLYIGAAIGWFLASLCYAAREAERENAKDKNNISA